MICHQIERAAKAYLVSITGGLVRAAGDPLIDDDGFQFVAMPQGMPGYTASGRSFVDAGTGFPVDGGLVFYFYTGENNADIKYPCAIVTANTGEGEVDNGNETVELSVSVKVTAAPYTGASTPLVTALEISDAIYNGLYRLDVCDYLNLYRTDAERLTVIGYTQRSSAKAVEGEAVMHQINLTLYCAAMNLSPDLPLQS